MFQNAQRLIYSPLKNNITMKKTTLKHFFLLAFLFIIFSATAISQEYLDNDMRYMKLTEISTDKNYGYDRKNPIKVGSDEKAIGAYLNSLKTLDGDRIHIGDMKFNYKRKSGLTLVVLAYEQKKEPTTIYFSSTKFKQPKAIHGFSFKTIDDLPKVILFPTDSIVKVVACLQTIYSVYDFLLKEKIGEKSQPTTNPTFTNGIDELKNYFTDNPLTDEKVQQSIFRVAISFIVDCKGEAGNFEIITKGKGDMATYANQVLAVVNSMPQKWQAATVEGKPVDCYQVLSFMVMNGRLDKVSYR